MRRIKKERKRIAFQRICWLFKQAERRAFENRMELASRYIYLARKISMRYLVRIPKKFKRRFCKHCYSYLIPGKNCRVRLKKHKIVITCLNCKNIMRYPYLKEIKLKRK